MASEQPRIKMPKEAAKGEIIEIKTLIKHPMESGQRKDASGHVIPRKIINYFNCKFNGKPVIDMVIGTGVAANPYISFFARVDEAGDFTFSWVDDDNVVTTATEHVALKA